jgi:hypothetical protein
MWAMTEVPVWLMARHARLSSVHAQALFAETLLSLTTLSNGLVATDGWLMVTAGQASLSVRVMLPLVDDSHIRLDGHDALALAVEPARLWDGVDVRISTERGLVSLPNGGRALERLCVTADDAVGVSEAWVRFGHDRSRERRVRLSRGDDVAGLVLGTTDAGGVVVHTKASWRGCL